jgi:hemerythrin-like domain-containing protein
MPTKKSSRPSRPARSDAIALLKEDHTKVRELLNRLDGGSGGATKSRQTLLSRVEQEIKIHSQIEEEIFYPAFREAMHKKNDRQLYFEAKEEHHIVDVVMDEFGRNRIGSDTFAAKCKVLKDLVEHHITEEERKMFPKVRKAMGKDKFFRLGEEIRQRRQEISIGTRRVSARGA